MTKCFFCETELGDSKYDVCDGCHSFEVYLDGLERIRHYNEIQEKQTLDWYMPKP